MSDTAAQHILAGYLHLARIEAGVRRTRLEHLNALAGHIDALPPADQKMVQIFLNREELIRFIDEGDEGIDRNAT
jgi:hypothetical protein